MIKIDDDFYIKVDDMNYTLLRDMHKKTVDKKTGEETEVYKTLGYYSKIYGAISRLIRYKQAEKFESSDMSLEEALVFIKQTNDEFEEILNRVVEMA